MPTGRAGVVFDLDGVIIDSESLQYRAYAQVLARWGVSVSPEEYGRYWISQGGGPEYASRQYRLPVSGPELRLLKNPIYHELLREVSLMPGVVAALGRLGQHFALAVATNSSQVDTAFVLERHRIRGYFAAVVTRESYVDAKPAPDAFVAAAAAIGWPTARCVAVEDSPRGVRAASRAGCRCVAVPHSFTRGDDFSLAARIVGSLDDVTVGLVDELLAA